MRMGTRAKILAGAVPLAAVLLLVVAGTAMRDDSDNRPTSASGTSASGTTASVPTRGAAAGPAPQVDTHKPTAAVRSLPPVAVGKAADLTSGIGVTIRKVSPTTIKADGPGEISGAGVSVVVEVKNSSSAAFDLSTIAVNAGYGKGIPAIRSDAAPSKDLSGSLKPGQTVSGTYLFTMPKNQFSTLKVDVSSGQAADIAVFRA